MATIREILNARPKPGEIWTATPETTVFEALEMMADKDVGALVVVKDGKVVGIFSERDYARKVILKGKSSREMRVAELMSAPVLYVRPDQGIQDCMALMTRRHVRHLPVLEGDELVGIVTIGDVVKEVISAQGETIEHLEQYIRGEP